MEKFGIALLCIVLCCGGLFAREAPLKQEITKDESWSFFDFFEHRAEDFSLKNAYLCASAVQMAQEGGNSQEIFSMSGFDNIIEGEDNQGGSRVVLAGNKRLILAIFYGPEQANRAKLWAFLQAGLTGDRWELDGARIHDGSAEGLNQIWDKFEMDLRSIRRQGQRVFLAGHGLGGSLAVLAAHRLVGESGIPVRGIYTFGQPRVGDESFADTFADVLSLTEDGSPLYRVVYKEDIVPRLKPPYVATKRLVTDTLSPYVHFGTLLFLDGDGMLRANPGVLEELEANAFELKEEKNHHMQTYQNLIYECLDDEVKEQMPQPMRRGRAKKVFGY